MTKRPHREKSKSTVGSPATWLREGFTAYQRGEYDAAEQRFQWVLKRDPRNADALHLQGLVARRRGDFGRAVEKIQTAISIAPKASGLYVSLGQALGDRGSTEASVNALKRAVELDPTSTIALFNLGLALEKSGDLRNAADRYAEAAAGSSPLAEASFNLGNVLLALGDVPEAVAAFQAAIDARPDYTRALANLAGSLQRLGRLDDAVEVYQRLLAIDPEDVEARHMHAALTGQTRDRADAAYVAKFFDDYAARFEDVLVGELEYQTPREIAEVVRAHPISGGPFTRAIDLGCGTGLTGRALAGLASVLVGVDLSANMVEKARIKGGYDELVVGDIVEVLAARTDRFDLFVASDVLNYLGDLAPVFEAVRARALPGARFAFSTEVGAEGFALDRTGRFLHGAAYVETTAIAAGLRLVSRTERTIRTERGVPVNGHLFLLESPPPE